MVLVFAKEQRSALISLRTQILLVRRSPGSSCTCFAVRRCCLAAAGADPNRRLRLARDEQASRLRCCSSLERLLASQRLSPTPRPSSMRLWTDRLPRSPAIATEFYIFSMTSIDCPSCNEAARRSTTISLPSRPDLTSTSSATRRPSSMGRN